MASIEKGSVPTLPLPAKAKGAPVPQPQVNCTLQDTFPDTTKGAGPRTQPYIYRNVNPTAETILSVTLDTDHPELWTLDAHLLVGVFQSGDYKAFNVTFTPPSQ